jgi:hypothetical protein
MPCRNELRNASVSVEEILDAARWQHQVGDGIRQRSGETPSDGFS